MGESDGPVPVLLRERQQRAADGLARPATLELILERAQLGVDLVEELWREVGENRLRSYGVMDEGGANSSQVREFGVT